MVRFMAGMVVVMSAEMPTICAPCSSTAATNFSGATSRPRLCTLKPAPFEHHGDEVLADVVEIALRRADDDHAERLSVAACLGDERLQEVETRRTSRGPRAAPGARSTRCA